MNKEIIHDESPKIQKLSGGEFEKFTQQVIKQLIEDNVPPTPTNYSIYFEKMLDTKPMAFKKRVTEMITYEKEDQSNKVAVIEQDIKETFVNIKQLVGSIATIYKNISTMKALIKKKIGDLSIATGSLSIQNILRSLDSDMAKLTTALDIQLNSIKKGYDEIVKIHNRVNEQSEFDDKFGVFNKRYLYNNITQDIEDIKKYGYSISLMFVKIKDSLLNTIELQKDKNLLMRNVAKLLLKTSRRSDVVAHYGDGIFVMAMKHTNIVNAKKACERISDLFYNTTFFINDNEIDINIEMSVVALSGDNYEEQILEAISVLPNTGKNKEIYAVIGDSEENDA